MDKPINQIFQRFLPTVNEAADGANDCLSGSLTGKTCIPLIGNGIQVVTIMVPGAIPAVTTVSA